MNSINIDKTDWKIVRLGDLATEISERVENPSKSRYERFVGLGNFVSGDIKIKSWDSTSSLASSAKAFKAGDILFARRNAYLRRASMVDFEGCCSGDAFVLRENLDKVVPGFLPFVMNSTGLWNYANANAAGTMSKRVKWRDLAKYEFLLPPKDQQAELAELLWAMDEVIEKNKEVLKSAQINLEVQSIQLIWYLDHPREPLVSYANSELSKLVDGDWIESKDQSSEGIRLLQLADIGVREFLGKSSRFISEDTFMKLKCFEVRPGDVLIARMPDPIGRSCIIPDSDEKMITAVDCCIVRVEHDSSNQFLNYLLNTREFLHKANLLASGTTRQRISRKTLEQMKVPKPTKVIQEQIVTVLDLFYATIKSCEKQISHSHLLQKSIINQIF